MDLPAGAVDLSAMRAATREPEQHRHRWSVMMMFAMEEDFVASLHEQHEIGVAAAARGEDPLAHAQNIQLPLTDDNMAMQEGPGCQKCGIIWLNGYGDPCPVSDREYATSMLQSRLNGTAVGQRDGPAAWWVEALRENGSSTTGMIPVIVVDSADAPE